MARLRSCHMGTVTTRVTPNPDAYPSSGVRERVRKGPLVRCPRHDRRASGSAGRWSAIPRQPLARHRIPRAGLLSRPLSAMIGARAGSATALALPVPGASRSRADSIPDRLTRSARTGEATSTMIRPRRPMGATVIRASHFAILRRLPFGVGPEVRDRFRGARARSRRQSAIARTRCVAAPGLSRVVWHPRVMWHPGSPPPDNPRMPLRSRPAQATPPDRVGPDPRVGLETRDRLARDRPAEDALDGDEEAELVDADERDGIA